MAPMTSSPADRGTPPGRATRIFGSFCRTGVRTASLLARSATSLLAAWYLAAVKATLKLAFLMAESALAGAWTATGWPAESTTVAVVL
jgi:hypothetical protein